MKNFINYAWTLLSMLCLVMGFNVNTEICAQGTLVSDNDIAGIQNSVTDTQLLSFLKGSGEEEGKVKIVLVPGLFNNIALKMKNSTVWSNYIDYLQKKGLKKDSDFYVLKYNTQAGPSTTIPQITAELKKIIYPEGETTAVPNKVIIVGHSKGSLDSMLTLIDDVKRSDPSHFSNFSNSSYHLSITPHVKAILLLSNPWTGTPIGDTLYKYALSKIITKGVLKLAGGDSECFKEITVKERSKFNNDPYNTFITKNLLQEIPILSVTSYLDSENVSFVSKLKYSIPKKYYEMIAKDESSKLTDGAILTSAGYAIGSDYILLKGPSHQDMIMNLELEPQIDDFFKYLTWKSKM